MKSGDSVGRRLRKERARLGISIDDAYKSIKIHPRILEALEEDKIDPTIGEVYARAFLRKYASFLGVDSAKALNDLGKKEHTEEPAKEKTVIEFKKQDRFSPAITKHKIKEKLLPVIASVAVIFTIYIIGYASVRLVNAFKRFLTRPAVVVTAEGVISATETGGTESAFPIPRGIPLALKVETKDEVWLRVKSDGKTIFEHTLAKGSAETWHAKENLELRVGRGEALTLTLNGISLDLPGRGLIRSLIINRHGIKK